MDKAIVMTFKVDKDAPRMKILTVEMFSEILGDIQKTLEWYVGEGYVFAEMSVEDGKETREVLP